MLLMKILNPAAVKNRRRRRLKRRVYQNKVYYSYEIICPVWHTVSRYRDQILFGTLMDMTLKLKPYGFAIHGCIDGFVYIILYLRNIDYLISLINRFSRKLLWLRIGSTNNNPSVILLYYLLQVLSCKGNYAVQVIINPLLRCRCTDDH